MKIFFILIAACATMSQSNAIERNSNSCGVPQVGVPLIIGGKNITSNSFPWIVALKHIGRKNLGYICGGTLISKTFVISAAHCILGVGETERFQPQDILAFIGAHNLSKPNERGRIELSPKEIYIHEDWDNLSEKFDADISLLEFEKGTIRFNRYIQPICLWDSVGEPTETEGIVIGWGKSETRRHEEIPKMVKAPIEVDLLECILGTPALGYYASKRTLCAGARDGSGVCRGDSGGGLVINVRGVYYLRGIVSTSILNHEGCDVWNYAVYTNVLKFRDWIKGMTTAEKVFCTFTIDWGEMACNINQLVDTENFIIASSKNTSIEIFDASNNKQTKFLPRGIGEKFPNLKTFRVINSGLTIVRDFHFKNMGMLKYLYLNDNQIKTIEPKAFDDLVSLQSLVLHGNQIETLDEKLFVNLVNLKTIHLNDNKIKFLSPTTFKIPGNEKLRFVGLWQNGCIDKSYGNDYSPLSQLESDLRTNCTQ